MALALFPMQVGSDSQSTIHKQALALQPTTASYRVRAGSLGSACGHTALLNRRCKAYVPFSGQGWALACHLVCPGKGVTLLPIIHL